MGAEEVASHPLPGHRRLPNYRLLLKLISPAMRYLCLTALLGPSENGIVVARYTSETAEGWEPRRAAKRYDHFTSVHVDTSPLPGSMAK